MIEPPPTRCELLFSDIIFFDEICDNCKKYYIKKISLKFHRIKTSFIELNMLVCISLNASFGWVNIYVCGCYFEVAIQIKQEKLNCYEISLFAANNLVEGKSFVVEKSFFHQEKI